MNPLNPKKLLLSKWTAVTPVAKQKHFLVSKVIKPDLPTAPVEFVEIESVFSKASQVIPWRELQNDSEYLGLDFSVGLNLKSRISLRNINALKHQFHSLVC